MFTPWERKDTWQTSDKVCCEREIHGRYMSLNRKEKNKLQLCSAFTSHLRTSWSYQAPVSLTPNAIYDPSDKRTSTYNFKNLWLFFPCLKSQSYSTQQAHTHTLLYQASHFKLTVIDKSTMHLLLTHHRVIGHSTETQHALQANCSPLLVISELQSLPHKAKKQIWT